MAMYYWLASSDPTRDIDPELCRKGSRSCVKVLNSSGCEMCSGGLTGLLPSKSALLTEKRATTKLNWDKIYLSILNKILYLDSTDGEKVDRFFLEHGNLVFNWKVFIILSLMILFATSVLPKRSNICCYHWFPKILILQKAKLQYQHYTDDPRRRFIVSFRVLHREILFWRYFGLCAMLRRCYWLFEALWQMSPTNFV